MNLPPEAAQRWGECIRIAERHLKVNRRFRWASAFMAILYPLLATTNTLQGRLWPALFNLLLCWFMYRMYRRCLKDEQQWKHVRHHLGRVLAETTERALWHTEQTEVLLEEIKKS